MTGTQRGGDNTRGRVKEGLSILPTTLSFQPWPTEISHTPSNIVFPFGNLENHVLKMEEPPSHPGSLKEVTGKKNEKSSEQ